MFKKIVGGDVISVQAKYKNAVACRFPGKLTLYQNDTPRFQAAEAFAIRRRIWVLPMRTQHLKIDDTKQRQKLISEGKAQHIVDLDDAYDILEDLKANHTQAYLKWVVQGAVACYAEGIANVVPESVKVESNREGRDKMQLFETFVVDYLVPDASTNFISSNEIKEVFLMLEDFDTSLDDKTEKEIFRLMKRLFDPPKEDKDALKPIIRGVKSHSKLYPGRNKMGRLNGYQGLAWKPGEVGIIVNKLRRDYCRNKLMPVSEVAVVAEEPPTPPPDAPLAAIFALAR